METTESVTSMNYAATDQTTPSIYEIDPTTNTTVVVVFGGTETFLMKVNGSWIEVTQVYKKINGVWVEQSDLSNIFDTDTKYVKKQ